jgi:hypothetical protein
MTTTKQQEFADSPDELVHLAYVSTQTGDMSARELLELLTNARKVNTERHITGLLLHKNRSYFQVLEGTRAEVDRTFAAIEQDGRHHGVEVLFDESLDEREFEDWRMGFMDLDGVDASLLAGYSAFFDKNEEPRAFLKALSRGQRLALLFKDLG